MPARDRGFTIKLLLLFLILLSGCAGAEREIARLEQEGLYNVGPCRMEIIEYTGVQCKMLAW